MAKAGKKVLVLEQHDQAGGCCHTYIEKGFEFDVGELNKIPATNLTEHYRYNFALLDLLYGR